MITLSPLFAGGARTMAEDFASPGDRAKPYVWWHWCGTAVTEDGIKRDLAAMKDSGIGGAMIFSLPLGHGVVSPNKFHLMSIDDWDESLYFGSDRWWRLVGVAAAEAEKLGLEIGMHNSPGYSTSGGPWVSREDAMKKLVWTKAPKGTKPPQPETVLGFYRDIAEVVHGDSVYRFGYTLTGKTCHPAMRSQNGKCLEVDKMSSKAVNRHIDRIFEGLGKYVRLGRCPGFKFLLMDSYEAGRFDWTDDFREEFSVRGGYDLVPYLPLLADVKEIEGRSAASFKADMRRVRHELTCERHYVLFQDRCREKGLYFYVEPYSSPDFNQFDVSWEMEWPMKEMWAMPAYWSWPGDFGGYPGIQFAVARAARRRILGCEAFTAMPFDDRWSLSPRDLKRPGDATLARGINRLVLHHWVHQPFDPKLKPGMGMGFWGTHFGQNQSWHELGKEYYRYLGRCQALLQRGEQVVDYLAVDRYPYGFEYFDAVPGHVWKKAVRLADGSIRLQTGRVYKGLVDERPADAKDPFNLILPKKRDRYDDTILCCPKIDDDGTRFFFICNTSEKRQDVLAEFRAEGPAEFWYPADMRKFRAPRGECKDGYTKMSFPLKPLESLFIIFRVSDASLPVADFSDGREALVVGGPWKVSFEKDRGAPEEGITLESLESLSEHAVDGVRYFSGKALYRTLFDAPGVKKAMLDLGEVRDIARVRLNGVECGTAWYPLYHIHLPEGVLKERGNVLEVEVANGWANRLIGDKKLPDDVEWLAPYHGRRDRDGTKALIGRGIKRIPDWVKENKPRPSKGRVTFTIWDYFGDDEKPGPSGLIGPVRLLVK